MAVTYFLNHNEPGYLPDAEPLEFEALDDLNTSILLYVNDLKEVLEAVTGEVVLLGITDLDLQEMNPMTVAELRHRKGKTCVFAYRQ